MVKIRKSKGRYCNSCGSNGGRFYDIGIGKKDRMSVTALCDTCMHVLLQKLTILESEKAEEK